MEYLKRIMLHLVETSSSFVMSSFFIVLALSSIDFKYVPNMSLVKISSKSNDYIT